MCEICDISGRNIFPETGVHHDVDEDFEGLEPGVPEVWYVWRRGDSMVGITSAAPTEVFTDEYAYYTLLITGDYENAVFEAMQARLCN